VIAARHKGLPVFAVSIITNMGLAGLKSTHEEVQAEGAKAEVRMTKLFTGFARRALIFRLFFPGSNVLKGRGAVSRTGWEAAGIGRRYREDPSEGESRLCLSGVGTAGE